MLRNGSGEKEGENKGARALFSQWVKLKRECEEIKFLIKKMIKLIKKKIKNVQHHN